MCVRVCLGGEESHRPEIQLSWFRRQSIPASERRQRIGPGLLLHPGVLPVFRVAAGLELFTQKSNLCAGLRVKGNVHESIVMTCQDLAIAPC